MACLRCEGLGTLCPRCRRDHRHRRAFTQAIMPKQQNYAVLPEWAFDRVCQLKTAAAKNIALYFYKRTLKYYQYTAIITYHEFVYGRIFKNQALEQGSGCHSYREVAAGIRECLAAGIFTLERQMIQGRRCIVYRVLTPFDEEIRTQHAQEAEAAVLAAVGAEVHQQAKTVTRVRHTPPAAPQRDTPVSPGGSEARPPTTQADTIEPESQTPPPAPGTQHEEAPAEETPSWVERLAQLSVDWLDTNPQDTRAYVYQLQQEAGLEDEEMEEPFEQAAAETARKVRDRTAENPIGLFRYRLRLHVRKVAKWVQERREQEALYKANRRYWDEQEALRAAEQDSESEDVYLPLEEAPGDSLHAEPAEGLYEGATAAPLAGQARQIWQSTLERIQTKISPAAFNTWFGATSGVALRGQVLTVHVGTIVHKSHLEKRFHDLICSLLYDVLGGEAADVRFEVADDRPEETSESVPEADSSLSEESPPSDPATLRSEPTMAAPLSVPGDLPPNWELLILSPLAEQLRQQAAENQWPALVLHGGPAFNRESGWYRFLATADDALLCLAEEALLRWLSRHQRTGDRDIPSSTQEAPPLPKTASALDTSAQRWMEQAHTLQWPKIVIVGKKRVRLVEGEPEWRAFWAKSSGEEQRQAKEALTRLMKQHQQQGPGEHTTHQGGGMSHDAAN